jgi:hypothetical protein
MQIPKTWQFFMRFDAYWDGSTRRSDTLQLSMIRAVGVIAMLPDVPPIDVAGSAVANAMIPVLQLIGRDEVAHGDLRSLLLVYEHSWTREIPLERDRIICKYARNAARWHPNQQTIVGLLEAIIDMCLLLGISRDAFEMVLDAKATALEAQGVVGLLE